jgi:dGTPase
MYRHDSVTKETDKAKRIVRELFERFLESPEDLPREWQRQTDEAGSAVTARVVADYIAGMTDRYAMMQHNRLFKVETRV